MKKLLLATAWLIITFSAALPTAISPQSWCESDTTLYKTFFSPDGQTIALHLANGKVQIWSADPACASYFSELGTSDKPIRRLAFGPDSQAAVISGNLDGPQEDALQLRDLHSGALLKTLTTGENLMYVAYPLTENRFSSVLMGERLNYGIHKRENYCTAWQMVETRSSV